MPKENIMTIVHVVIPLIAAFAGAYIAHCFSVGRENRNHKRMLELFETQEFNKAASEFHATFIEAQRRLDESKSFDICGPNNEGVRSILNSMIVEHETAMIKFRPFIKKSTLSSFDKAWKVYYSQENRNAQCLSEYKSKLHHNTKDPKHEGEVRVLALLRIEKLLSFTEIKNT